MVSMKRFLSIVLSLITLTVFADEVVFKAQAPKQVVVGRPFQVTYTVNQRSRDLRAPEFTDFDVLSGPYTSTSSSTSFVNGKRTSSFEQTYTYMLMAQKAGTSRCSPTAYGFRCCRRTSNRHRAVSPQPAVKRVSVARVRSRVPPVPLTLRTFSCVPSRPRPACTSKRH